MPRTTFCYCIEQWLLRTYVPLNGLPNQTEPVTYLGTLPTEAYRHRYAIGAEEFRSVFVIVADHPEQVSPSLVQSFRQFVKKNNGLVGYLFCQEEVSPDVIELPTKDKDYSVLVIAGEMIAGIMLDKGVGVRQHPLWHLDGPRWMIDEEFFNLIRKLSQFVQP